MYDTICTIPLQSDIFAQAIHPNEPLVVVGTSSGHVRAYKLPADDDEEGEESEESSPPAALSNGNGFGHPILRRSSTASASESGLGAVDNAWETRRHKGSCRCLAFTHDGEVCYSAGTDGLVKAFLAETGRVVSKTAIPLSESEIDAPTVLYALSPQALLLGTDSGKVYLQDLRQGGKEVVARASQVWTPHGDQHVNALVPLPASETSTSGFPKQWVSVGGTTLAVTDLRKGTISTSEDQEVELTSVSIVRGLKKGGTSVGEKVLVGQGDGVVSLWERGVWGDLDERIVLDREGSGVECFAEVPSGMLTGKWRGNEKIVATGLEDGRIRFTRIGRNHVLVDLDLKHDDIDGVAGVGFDVTGRMISSGGQTIKMWTEAKGRPGGGFPGVAKHNLSDDEGEDDEDEDEGRDESDEDSDNQSKSKRKKRKRNKGKDKSGGKALDFSL